MLDPFKTDYVLPAYSESSVLSEFKLELLSAQSFQDRLMFVQLTQRANFLFKLALELLRLNPFKTY